MSSTIQRRPCVLTRLQAWSKTTHESFSPASGHG